MKENDSKHDSNKFSKIIQIWTTKKFISINEKGTKKLLNGNMILFRLKKYRQVFILMKFLSIFIHQNDSVIT